MLSRGFQVGFCYDCCRHCLGLLSLLKGLYFGFHFIYLPPEKLPDELLLPIFEIRRRLLHSFVSLSRSGIPQSDFFVASGSCFMRCLTKCLLTSLSNFLTGQEPELAATPSLFKRSMSSPDTLPQQTARQRQCRRGDRSLDIPRYPCRRFHPFSVLGPIKDRSSISICVFSVLTRAYHIL